MSRYFPVAENGADMMEFMLLQVGLNLTNQPLDGPNWFCATVRDSEAENIIVAAVACEFKTAFDVHFSAAVADPGAISRRVLRGVFQSLFSRASRITALADPRDERSNELIKRLGFVYEGFLRLGLDGVRDANLYGMLRSDCRYLADVRAIRSFNGGGPHGQSTETARSGTNGISAAGG